MAGTSKINPKEIVGTQVNGLLILKHIGRGYDLCHMYLIKCLFCGKKIETRRQNLTGTKKIKSCGCQHPSKLGLRSGPNNPAFKHGRSRDAIHNRWSAMMSRCYCKTNKKFKNYGARGIKVCYRWHNFSNFLKDVGEPPENNLSLDRIDVNGDYEPGNVRWTDQKTQQNNRRNNRFITAFGVTKSLKQWEKETGIRAAIIRQRIDRDKKTPEKALTK